MKKLEPNEETKQVIEETDRGENMVEYKDLNKLKGLFNDLFGEEEKPEPKYKKYMYQDCIIEATPDMSAINRDTWITVGIFPLKKGDMVARNPDSVRDTWIISEYAFKSAVELGKLPTKEQNDAYRDEMMSIVQAGVDSMERTVVLYEGMTFSLSIEQMARWKAANTKVGGIKSPLEFLSCLVSDTDGVARNDD